MSAGARLLLVVLLLCPPIPWPCEEISPEEMEAIRGLEPVEMPQPAWGCFDALCFDPSNKFRQTGFETGLEA